jgi:hypothetical protein
LKVVATKENNTVGDVVVKKEVREVFEVSVVEVVAAVEEVAAEEKKKNFQATQQLLSTTSLCKLIPVALQNMG